LEKLRMIVRVVRTLAVMAVLGSCMPSVWAQVSRPQPGGQSQPRELRPAPRSGNAVKEEFKFTEEEPRPRTNPIYRGPVNNGGAVENRGPVKNLGPIENRGAVENRGPIRPVGGVIEERPRAPSQPQIIACPWDPLTRQEQQQLDQLMQTWEKHSSKIERYRCKFERWEYDPIFGPKDPTKAKTYGQGSLMYSAPDKGLFKVESLKVYVPAGADSDEDWRVRPAEEIGEHWVCDGKNIFEFDARQKKLVQRELPPEMHGKAIVDGPLPFLFGAKAAKIAARYWLREITPGDVEGERWIEAVPKYSADAKNFKMVHVSIDEKDFLPKAIQVFDPQFDPKKKPIRSVYTFKDREYNWNTTWQQLNFFHREFYEPKAPLGWTKVVEPFFGEPGQPPAGKPPTAQRPNPFKIPFKQR
jgi:TIGR03009 family protein